MQKYGRDIVVSTFDWTNPSKDGLHRRTIVKGAAWTVPVVAVAMATPVAAASKMPTLKFTQASYSGTACGTITGLQVKRTSDGTTAEAGKIITVTLKDGYKFKDSSTTYTATTGTDGTITLPDITVPATGGDSTFNAMSNALSASAPVSATKVTSLAKAQQYGSATASTTYKAPQGDGLTAVGYGTFLNAVGDLFHNETKQATGVTSAVAENNGTYDTVTYVENGVAKAQQYGSATTITTYKAPTGAGLKAAGYATFLNSAGTLWHNETQLAVSGVTSAVAENNGTYDTVTYVENGVAKAKQSGSSTAATTYTSPKGAGLRAVGYATFLNDAGDLWYGNTLVASGVSSAVAEEGGGFSTVTYVKDGVGYAQEFGSKTAKTTYKAPTGAGLTAVGYATFLNTAGDLYHNETKQASNVTSAVGENGTSKNAGTDTVTYVQKPVCK